MAQIASPAAAPRTTAKACVASNGTLRLTRGTRCPSGLRSFTALAKGGPGTALGYVHIKAGGFFDASRSYNVKASNINSASAGFYCFKGLKFTPHSVEVTMDYNGLLNGQIAANEVQLPPDHTTCPAGAQAMIFTGLTNRECSRAVRSSASSPSSTDRCWRCGPGREARPAPHPDTECPTARNQTAYE